MKLDQQTNPHQQHGEGNKKVNVADNCLCCTDELHLALTILVFARGEIPILRIAMMKTTTFLFATTRDSEIDKAFLQMH